VDQKDSTLPRHDREHNRTPDAAARFFDLSSYPLMLNIAEVADICRCDHQAVRRRINRGELAYTKIGSLIRVPREALGAYLLTQTRFGRDTSEVGRDTSGASDEDTRAAGQPSAGKGDA